MAVEMTPDEIERVVADPLMDSPLFQARLDLSPRVRVAAQLLLTMAIAAAVFAGYLAVPQTLRGISDSGRRMPRGADIPGWAMVAVPLVALIPGAFVFLYLREYFRVPRDRALARAAGLIAGADAPAAAAGAPPTVVAVHVKGDHEDDKGDKRDRRHRKRREKRRLRRRRRRLLRKLGEDDHSDGGSSTSSGASSSSSRSSSR